ncbi:hypothetical protein ACFO5R_17350 [Halosolutus amylolyticus]|uniref:Uncharacterized protein n=1 Tax=Halosolutus amylolyticus TaxID=2932267 RepID=A0ABD5PSX0_9EURY|nr:hypothetical protein [Halosolutus amylolyticus]
MSDDRIVRRLNVVIGLLLVIIVLQIRTFVSPVVLSVGVAILAPAAILLVIWALAKGSLAIESS